MEREELKQYILENLQNIKYVVQDSVVADEEASTITQKIEALETCENLHDFAMDVDLYCNMVLKAFNELLDFKFGKKNFPINYLQTGSILLQKITDDRWESGSKNVVLKRSGENWIANIKEEEISTEFSTKITKLQDLPELVWKDDFLKHNYLNGIAPCYVLVTIKDNDYEPTLLRWKWTNLVHGYSNKYDEVARFNEFLRQQNMTDNEDAKAAFIEYKKNNQTGLLNVPVYKRNYQPVQLIKQYLNGWCTRVFTEDNEGKVFEDFYTLNNNNLFAETGWKCNHPRNNTVKLRVYPAT